MASIELSASGLGWDLPDGRPLLSGIDLHLGPGRAALVGPNGVGKSTLLRILAGRLAPARGTVRRSGVVELMPQDLSPLRAGTVAGALGVGPAWEAWTRVREGAAREEDGETLADAWDIEDRVLRALAEAGLPALDPSRRAEALSGGELVRLAFAGARLRDPDFLLLDEPSNHLDSRGREALRERVAGWGKGLLAASHDRGLLRGMDRILELSNLGLRAYGGGYGSYSERREAEDAAARGYAEAMEARVRKDLRERRDARERQERRSRKGARDAAGGGMPKILAGARKRRAEGTAARLKDVHDDRVAGSREAAAAARERLREDPRIRVDLGSAPPPARKLLVRAEAVNHRFADGVRLWDRPLSFELRGNPRVSLAGDNGSGKSLFVAMLRGILRPSEGRLVLGDVPMAVLDQHVSLLDDGLTVLGNLARRARPGLAEPDLRVRLGRFGFPGAAAGKPAAALSGGERMRLGLACLLAADNAPGLLVLDEPTNDLDFAGREAVESALADFRGGLLVVSHDPDFLRSLGVEEEIRLERARS